jgi:hypothetical protein
MEEDVLPLMQGQFLAFPLFKMTSPVASPMRISSALLAQYTVTPEIATSK